MNGEQMDLEEKMSDAVAPGHVDMTQDPDAGLSLEEKAKAV